MLSKYRGHEDHLIYFDGGPYHGMFYYRTPGVVSTLRFRCSGWCGFYNDEGVWEQVS
jgi:hypothetical protein